MVVIMDHITKVKQELMQQVFIWDFASNNPGTFVLSGC